MTLLANKVAELIDEAIAKSGSAAWRGTLSTQEWKILVQYVNDNEIIIKTLRRDDSTGVPE